MIKAIKIVSAGHPLLTLQFSDGSVGTVDLSPLLERRTVMTEPLNAKDFFAWVFLEAGAPTWPNGLDLALWALHADLAASGKLIRPQIAS